MEEGASWWMEGYGGIDLRSWSILEEGVGDGASWRMEYPGGWRIVEDGAYWRLEGYRGWSILEGGLPWSRIRATGGPLDF